MNRRRASLAAFGAALVIAGCGGSSHSSGKPSLIISAAASLKQAFTRYSGLFSGATIHFSFAGSDTLAAQIEQGVRPDVFASANTKLPDKLYAKGLVEKPVVFAANTLVLAVPTNSKIRSLADAEKPGVRLVIGTPTVPVGSYTDTVLARLPAAERTAILANVKDREPDVTGILGKLTQGAADGGFLYLTDVNAAGGKLLADAIPPNLRPKVAYGIAVVKGTAHRAQAREFVEGLLGGIGRAYLAAAGFLPPPSG
jgi:molybdate transport system substrate-binding protein